MRENRLCSWFSLSLFLSLSPSLSTLLAVSRLPAFTARYYSVCLIYAVEYTCAFTTSLSLSLSLSLGPPDKTFTVCPPHLVSSYADFSSSLLFLSSFHVFWSHHHPYFYPSLSLSFSSSRLSTVCYSATFELYLVKGGRYASDVIRKSFLRHEILNHDYRECQSVVYEGIEKEREEGVTRHWELRGERNVGRVLLVFRGRFTSLSHSNSFGEFRFCVVTSFPERQACLVH